MTSVLTFSVSLFVIALLLLARYFELRAGKTSFWGHFMDRSDKFVESAWYKGKLFWKIVSYAILVSFKAVGPEVKKLYFSIHGQTKGKFKDAFGVLSGRKKLTKRGAISFYLKQISEDKK